MGALCAIPICISSGDELWGLDVGQEWECDFDEWLFDELQARPAVTALSQPSHSHRLMSRTTTPVREPQLYDWAGLGRWLASPPLA